MKYKYLIPQFSSPNMKCMYSSALEVCGYLLKRRLLVTTLATRTLNFSLLNWMRNAYLLEWEKHCG